MNIEKELFEWAKETVNDYNKTKACFYTQSPLDQIKNDEIELLVLGINPGSSKESFEEILKKNQESVWRSILTEEGMTPEAFLKGNPSYISMIKGESKEWSYWKKLCDLLHIAGMSNLIENLATDHSSFVLTNIFHGSTKEESEISVDDFKKYKDHTFKLIELLKPKRIICLGQRVMDVVLEKYYKDKIDKNCYVLDLPIRYKEINNVKVFGFHHPASRYTTEEKDLVGKFLKYYDNNDFDPKNPLPTEELKDSAEKYRIRKAKKLNPEVINLEQQINTQGARQSVWKDSTIVYEFYTDKNPKTNEFKESNNMIVIDLVLLGNNEYEINVFTRKNNCEQTKEIATGIFGSYNPNTKDPSRHLYAKIQTEDQKEIVDKMNELLPKVRSYRDEHYQ